MLPASMRFSTRCSNRRALRRSAPASKASSLRGMLSASSTTRSSEAMSPEIGVRTGEGSRDHLEDPHPLLAREPCASHGVGLDLLDARRAGDEQQLFEHGPEQRILAKDAEGG